MRIYQFSCCLLLLLALIGCGGGSGGTNTPSQPSQPTQPVNTAPNIDNLSVRSINSNGQVSVSWRVSDNQQTNLSCTIAITGAVTIDHAITNCVTTTQYTFTVPENGTYVAVLQVSDGELSNTGSLNIPVSSIPATTPPVTTPPVTTPPETTPPEVTPPSSQTMMKIHFLHTAQQYDIWGLHLWGNAIAAEDQTTWQNPRPLTRIEADYAVFEVPIIDGSEYFNFIVHFGDIKSPAYDLRVIPDDFGTQIWVVQDTAVNITGINAEPFADEAMARAALNELEASIGNASNSIDLSPVDVIVPNSSLPQNWQKNANFMEIYVRGYKDSDGDGIGDINGLIEQLDYLETLGITGLWLMPIMESSDNDHGYETQDYRKIESDYGTNADFERLLEQAHQRGIAIVIDYLINHASYQNPVFIDSASSPNHPKRDWFIWRDVAPTNWSLWGRSPWRTGVSGNFYGAFTSRMPDFNLLNPEVIAFHQSNLAYWLNKGVDGFRFDAVGVLVENGPGALEDQAQNHTVMRAMRDIISQYPHAYMVCEAPSSYAQFAQDNSCGKAFHFSAGHQIINSVKAQRVQSSLISIINDDNLANMPLILANHDFFAGDRIANQLNNNLTQYRLAAASYILLSANPFTYYGEEIGMAAATNMQDDASLRTPMSWTNDSQTAGFTSGNTTFRGLSANATTANVAAQINASDSLYTFYQTLYALRQAHPEIATGTKTILSQANDSVLIWRSQSAEDSVLVAINLSGQTATDTVQLGQSHANDNLNLIFNHHHISPSELMTDTNGAVTLDIAGYSITVWAY